MPQHPNTTRKQTQAKNKKSQKTKFLAFLAIYERCAMFIEKFGAGKRSRTVDLNLGKVALYQLSYSRVFWRRDPESNRARRICNPLHNRFAIAPGGLTR